VKLAHKRITLTVRPGSSREKREQVMQEWHRSLLHQVVPPLIAKWEGKLGVTVEAYYLQGMRRKWGSCNHKAGNIRLNTELVKKPKDLLEYVVVHEMVHLIEPTHSDRFVDVMNRSYPTWREARHELNELPLGLYGYRPDGFSLIFSEATNDL
jgi:predicted metal-dependent hydrolase